MIQIKKYKNVAIIAAIITIIIIITLLITTSPKKQNDIVNNSGNIDYDENGTVNPYTYLEENEYFIKSDEKEKLEQEQKEFKNYTFSNFKLVHGEDKNRIILKVENKTDNTIDGKEIKIILYDKNNDKLDTIYIYTSQKLNQV